eukprot:scaffold267930_cov132-Cyclotella_meneghiniana.AAC.1
MIEAIRDGAGEGVTAGFPRQRLKLSCLRYFACLMQRVSSGKMRSATASMSCRTTSQLAGLKSVPNGRPQDRNNLSAMM